MGIRAITCSCEMILLMVLVIVPLNAAAPGHSDEDIVLFPNTAQRDRNSVRLVVMLLCVFSCPYPYN